MIPLDTNFVVSSGFLIAGAGVVIHGVLNLRRSLDSERWPIAEGEVTESRIGSSNRSYYPVVNYRYTVRGETYHGDTIAFGGPLEASWKSPARRIVERYPQGRKIRVRYSPEDPSVSVLEPQSRLITFFTILVGTMFAGIGAGKVLSALGWVPSF